MKRTGSAFEDASTQWLWKVEFGRQFLVPLGLTYGHKLDRYLHTVPRLECSQPVVGTILLTNVDEKSDRCDVASGDRGFVGRKECRGRGRERKAGKARRVWVRGFVV